MRAAAVVTCEHGGNKVPRAYRRLFDGAQSTLESHRGWDPGALVLGRALARALGAPFIGSEVTRLLVDLNRTKDDAGRFSEFTRGLTRAERESILEHYHVPHWKEAESALGQVLGRWGTVFHLASHSFTATPGRIGYARPDREYEIGLLYDPRRPREAEFVRAWRDAILRRDPELQVRLNQPYRGWTDGMPAVFRRKLGRSYLAVELECNQSSLADPRLAARMRKALICSLQETASLVTMGA